MVTNADHLNALMTLQRALERSFDSDWLRGSTAGTGSFPPINIFQQGEDFVAIAELPGVSKTDIEIQVQEKAIRISGSKTVSFDENASVHRRERSSGAFDRTITLPVQVDADRLKAEYRNGMLALFIPRAESDKPRTIKNRLVSAREEAPMDEIPVQEKRELSQKQEGTVPARSFMPSADIFETENALEVVLEMPGVEKDHVEISVEDDVLDVSGTIDFARYQGLRPLYTEYPIGHYRRSFSLSNRIDQHKITAELSDGVLTVTLPKAEQAKPRKIVLA